MTVGELKKKLEKMDDELEIRVAPLIETENLSGVGFVLEPHPERQYPVAGLHLSRKVEGDDFGPYALVLGFDPELDEMSWLPVG
jgi:hypothetical protein